MEFQVKSKTTKQKLCFYLLMTIFLQISFGNMDYVRQLTEVHLSTCSFFNVWHTFFLLHIAVVFQCSHSLERYLECGIKIMWKCSSELVIIDLLHHTEVPLVFLFLLPWAIIMGSSCQSVDIIFPAVPSGSLALEVVLASLLFPLIFVKC